MKKSLLSISASVLLFAGGTSASACWQPVSKPVETVKQEQPVEQVNQQQEEQVVITKPETQPETKPVTVVTSEVQQVLDETNKYRTQNGLSKLTVDSKLTATAQDKAEDMATKRYFSHTSPTYGSPFDQMKQAGITYRRAAENIAMGQRSAAEVVKAWMDSPGHRANILDRNLTHIGIGYDANGRYWVQQFIQK